MGQSKFQWIIVYGDGYTIKFNGTWDELLSWKDFPADPIAIIRGDLI